MRQQKLFKLEDLRFGGSLNEGKAKKARPFSPKTSMHVTLKVRPEVRALLFKKNRNFCQLEISKWARKFNVKVKTRSVNTTHIHLIASCLCKKSMQSFFRVLAGQ